MSTNNDYDEDDQPGFFRRRGVGAVRVTGPDLAQPETFELALAPRVHQPVVLATAVR